jgi:hypothetical protein
MTWDQVRRKLQTREAVTMDDLEELSDYVACDALTQTEYRDLVKALLQFVSNAESDELFEQALYVANGAALNLTSDFTCDTSTLCDTMSRAKDAGALQLALSLIGICGDSKSFEVLEKYGHSADLTVQSEALHSLEELRSKLARNTQ